MFAYKLWSVKFPLSGKVQEFLSNAKSVFIFLSNNMTIYNYVLLVCMIMTARLVIIAKLISEPFFSRSRLHVS